MGYFNYFIKCIIRNLAYKFCKPKVFLTVLLSVCILFGLKHFGYCTDAWTDGDIQQVHDGLATITNNQGVIISQLSQMGVNVGDIEKEIVEINNLLSGLSSTTSNISDKITTLVNKVENLSVQVNNIILTMEENNEELKNTFIQENNKTVEKLTQIYDYLYGFSTETGGSYSSISGEIYPNGNIGGSSWIKTGYMSYNPKYRYKITFNYSNTSGGSFTINISGSQVAPYVGLVTDKIMSYGLSGGRTYTYIVDSGLDYKFINFSYFSSIGISISVIEDTPGALGGIQDGLDKGNQLQEESNQLQQDQNDFLKQETTDGDVSVDGFNSVDSNDITSDGLSGIFTTIYNSINSWSSKDIILPVPFTNKSFTIPSNYTYEMLSRVGGGFLISIISTVYYFIVARFIIYTITGIINSIKSGSILETDSKNNITTEML